MQLTKLTLRNVRCFDNYTTSLTAPRVIIEGPNGSGKSSIVESLHYACYLRSFRASSTRDIANKSGDGTFFIELAGEQKDGELFTIQIGFSDKTKRVKVNGKQVHTYKDVMAHYRVVTVAEHDLALIQDGPEFRRSFINQFCLLDSPSCMELLRQHKQVVSQRNGLLLHGQGGEQLKVWTQQLWQHAEELTALRVTALKELEKRVNEFFQSVRSDAPKIGLSYVRKHRKVNESFDEFWERYESAIIPSEYNMKRTLFGAHLDDIAITLDGRSTRSFASRGQQKLVLVLLKLAQVAVLQEHAPMSGMLLVLDDLITDFDATVLQEVLKLINGLSCAVLITCPLADMVSLPEPVHVVRL